MIWLNSGLKAAFLAGVAVLSVRLCQQHFLLFFPGILFLGIAYPYRVLEWMRCRSQGKPIPWVKLRWPSWREGINGLIVFFVSLFVAFFIATLVTGGTLLLVFSILSAVLGDSFTPELTGVFGRHTAYHGVSQTFFSGMATVWVAIATCLYRYEFWAQQRRKSRRTPPRPPSPIKPPPVDSVDLDLDHLRSNLGLTQMKARQRRKSKP